MTTASRNGNRSLEELVEDFEAARAVGKADVESFLPPDGHPEYGNTLVELIRVDLELAWRSNARPRLVDYRRRFADVLNDTACFAPIAFEEYRLRRASGEACSREEYRDEFGVPADAWPELPVGRAGNDDRESPDWLSDLSRVDPDSASRMALAVRQFPSVGERFLEFELVGELGRGAFGRVYLARQGDLANRFVALKVTTQVTDEPQRLAQMQHTNIVPIYSLHRAGALQAVCMPFLGPNTLADVLQTFRVNRSLPLSGHALVSTMATRQASTVVRESKVTVSAQTLGETQVATAGSESLRRLDKMSYWEAAAWIAARLASGLAHAHEHGIVHRDIKPANVLLTDDGEPLILDFNLSSQSTAAGASAAMVGGTLPYMAPEHLRALRDGGQVAGTADIYSLGTILFEMLTGELPFPVHRGALDQVVARMLADRKQPAPWVRTRHRNVSTDLATIVSKCLAAAPEERYQTARQLQIDLERHLDHCPLAHAPNRSVGERLTKWRRRHPRLMSMASLTTIASLLVIGLLIAWMARGRRLEQYDAAQRAARFSADVAAARTVFNVPGIDEHTLRRAVASAEQAVGPHAENPGTFDRRFRRLPLNEQQKLRRSRVELLYLLGCGKALLGVRCGSDRERAKLLDEALRLNQLACSAFSSQELPQALHLQRARLLAAMGGDGVAPGMRLRRDAPTYTSEFDRYLLATELNQSHNYSAVIELLQSALRDKPQDYTLWMGLGSAHLAAGQERKAESCYTTCLALRPQLELAHFMRGVIRLNQQAFREAREDFDAVLCQHPTHPAALVNRALASMGLEAREDALADLDTAIGANMAETRVYFLRARLREQLGDRAGAEADRAEGLRRTPRDEASWLARGFAKLRHDPEGALNDLRQALQLNPQSTVALQNIAHVLSERLHRTDEALDVMNQLVDVAADDPLMRVNRGILLARLGRQDEAVADAQVAVQGTPSAAVQYRAACIYALLLSEQHNGCKTRALTCLGRALRAQPSLVDTAAHDPDLNSLRDDTTFRELLSAANALQHEPHPDG